MTVIVEDADGLRVITLNRPGVMNALNAAMRAGVRTAVEEAAGRGGRVVVLTGAGRAFCSGQDLADAGPEGAFDLETVLNEDYVPLLRAIRDCPLPVIAAVNGVAAGAGANLALACDVVIASEEAAFVQAFTRIGLMPDAGGTWTLPRQVGMARAMGAMLFGDRIGARQAADWGMIWEAVPAVDFEAAWRARAGTLARGPAVAYRGIKSALQASADATLEEQLVREARLQADCGRSADFREGLAAFAAKRPPRFEGR